MFSFHRFLEKLKFKCENTNTKLYVVTEEKTVFNKVLFHLLQEKILHFKKKNLIHFHFL